MSRRPPAPVRPSRPEALFNIIFPAVLAALAFTGMVTSDDGDDGGGGRAAECGEGPGSLGSPQGLAVDTQGNVVVVQSFARCVTVVSPSGTVRRLPGDFGRPHGVAVAPDGTVYVTDRTDGRVLKTTTAGGPVTLVARLPYSLLADVALSPAGDLYVGTGYEGIKRVTPAGVITSLGGQGSDPVIDGASAAATRIEGMGIAVGPDGSVYATARNQVVRLNQDGTVTLVAGTGQEGYGGDGGPAPKAKLARPSGLAVGGDGTVYIADTQNNRIRAVGPDGTITTVAGNGNGISEAGDGGPAVEARIHYPNDLALVGDEVYVAEGFETVVRVFRPGGAISSLGTAR